MHACVQALTGINLALAYTGQVHAHACAPTDARTHACMHALKMRESKAKQEEVYRKTFAHFGVNDSAFGPSARVCVLPACMPACMPVLACMRARVPVCGYACVPACACACTRVRTYVHLSDYLAVDLLSIRLLTPNPIFLSVWLCVCMHICVRACMCKRMCACMRVCVHVRMYAHTHL